jgi:hypothetical protein
MAAQGNPAMPEAALVVIASGPQLVVRIVAGAIGRWAGS